MRPVFIYTLNDPVTGIVRYCGQTPNPDRRLSGHLSDLKRRVHHNANWIRSLLGRGLKPVMEIIDVVPDSEADFWEREYIQNFRERGFDLTNGTDGGNCGPSRVGKKNTPEHNEKIRASLIGRKHSPERRANIGAAQVGRKQSPETIAKRAARLIGNKSHTGRTFSLEHRAALSAGGKGKKKSPETRAKISAAQLGKPRGSYKNKNVLLN